jgi:transposase
MIAYQTFCQLRQAWDEQHLTMAQIARALSLHPQTVKKWVGRPRYEQRRTARRARILDEHKPAITRWLAEHPFTATQLWQRLREQGYAGGCSIVRDYVRTVRPPRSPAYLTLTYAPGQCAQIDWGLAGAIPVGGTRRALSFFVLVLCHSRWLHVEFTLGQSQ